MGGWGKFYPVFLNLQSPYAAFWRTREIVFLSFEVVCTTLLHSAS